MRFEIAMTHQKRDFRAAVESSMKISIYYAVTFKNIRKGTKITVESPVPYFLYINIWSDCI